MKKNELIQIKGLDLKELRTKAKNIKDELANLVMDKNMKKLKDVKKISKKRRDLAQILTVIRQKEQFSVLSDQLSDESSSVVGQSVTEKQKTEKPESENRKQKTDNR